MLIEIFARTQTSVTNVARIETADETNAFEIFCEVNLGVCSV